MRNDQKRLPIDALANSKIFSRPLDLEVVGKLLNAPFKDSVNVFSNYMRGTPKTTEPSKTLYNICFERDETSGLITISRRIKNNIDRDNHIVHARIVSSLLEVMMIYDAMLIFKVEGDVHESPFKNSKIVLIIMEYFVDMLLPELVPKIRFLSFKEYKRQPDMFIPISLTAEDRYDYESEVVCKAVKAVVNLLLKDTTDTEALLKHMLPKVDRFKDFFKKRLGLYDDDGPSHISEAIDRKMK